MKANRETPMHRLVRAEFTLIELQRLYEAQAVVLGNQSELIERLEVRLAALERHNAEAQERIERNMRWSDGRGLRQSFNNPALSLRAIADDETTE